jgi:hypothetical protein
LAFMNSLTLHGYPRCRYSSVPTSIFALQYTAYPTQLRISLNFLNFRVIIRNYASRSKLV